MNLPVNKVIYDGNTLIDLSGDTVSPDKLMEGVTAHDKTGAQIVGTATGGGGATEPYVEETYDSYGNLTGAVLHGHTKVRNTAFSYCSKLALIFLPDGITTIGYSAFEQCPNLALSALPDGITSVENSAFSGCSKLTLTALPAEITSIGAYAFKGCTGLTAITFKGTPTTIGMNAFQGCTNLTTINVPWAEGAVANAPWGATNATINYNYTEGA